MVTTAKVPCRAFGLLQHAIVTPGRTWTDLQTDHTLCTIQGVRPCLCKLSSSDSLGSVDEDLIKELENVPVVLSTQDEMDVRVVVRGLKVGSPILVNECCCECTVSL